jgi:predicted Zn-dependent protease
MIPVYVWHDSGVGEKEVKVAVDSIKRVIKEGIDISKYLPLKVIGPVDSYLEKARKRIGSYGIQYDVSHIFNLCKEDPYREKPRIEFGILSKDLYSDDLNFVYGEAHPLANVQDVLGGSIVSTFRPKLWFGNRFLLAFRKTCIHELGHVFWVPTRRKNVEYSLGVHCIRGDCVMGQSNVERKILWEESGKIEKRFIDALEIAEKVEERIRKTGTPFCQDCLKELCEMKRNFEKFLKQEFG